MLPEQATLRTTGESQLYCLSCKGLVNAGDGQYDLAREAAKSEDFDLAAAKAAPVDSGPVVVIAALGKADPKPFTGDLFPGIVTTKKRRK